MTETLALDADADAEKPAELATAAAAAEAAEADNTQPADEIENVLEQVSPTVPNTQEELQQPQSQPLSPAKEAPAPPRSAWQMLRDKLREHVFDPDGWNRLVELAENDGDMEQIKETYESLLDVYPNTSAAQIAYLNHYLRPAQFPLAETLFKRFLKTSPCVDLWKFYLTYVRRVNTGPDTRDNIRMAYEFALRHVGHDKDSGELWSDYIQFLKSGEAATTWEEQQKMDAIRKAYQRAVQIPLDNVEKLWQEMEAFETNLNKITAKKFMTDLSPAKVQAVTVLRALQKHLSFLYPPPPSSSSSRPPIYLPPLPTFSAGERALVGQWKTYLKWEENNPLEIDDKDKATLVSRVQGVYRKSLIRMRFYSEIWYMAYVWTSSVGKQEEAVNILKAGIEANSSSFLLTFAYIEVLESKKEFTEVHATFDKFLGILAKNLEALESRIQNSSSSSISNGSAVAYNGSAADAGPQSNASSFMTQSSEEKPSKSKELHERQTEYGLVWIMYMRFARRAEGLKSSRPVFGKARRDKWTPWEVYEAAALTEYHVTKATDVASRIFEKGLELFGDEVEFVLRYLGFLISLNDDNNARALFERVISSFPPDRARPLWERWARYEYHYGDLEASQKLEKRIAEIYPNDPPIKRFALRHTYLGTDAIAARDLGFSMVRHGGPGSANGSLGRSDTQQSLLFGKELLPVSGPSMSNNKRPPSQERKREEPRSDHPPPYKRPRPLSPPPRERDRDRWEGPPRRGGRYGSPGWDRDRDMPPPRRSDREEDKPTVLPNVISWFIGMLPAPGSFDGPVFRTDDLMSLFRNAVIPSTSRAKSPPLPPPPPPRGGGRPPPDYGPYQGPGRGRRY